MAEIRPQGKPAFVGCRMRLKPSITWNIIRYSSSKNGPDINFVTHALWACFVPYIAPVGRAELQKNWELGGNAGMWGHYWPLQQNQGVFERKGRLPLHHTSWAATLQRHAQTYTQILFKYITTSLSFQFASENGCVFDKCKRSHPAHRPHMNRVQVQINVSCMVLTLMPSLKQQVNITCVVVAPQLRCKRRGRPGWDEAQQTEQNIGVESCNLKVWISCDSCEPPTQTEEWRKAYRVKFQSRAERDSP